MKRQYTFLSNIVCILLILCFGFILFNTAFNGHLHKQDNGLLLYHSHPFDRSNGTGTSGSHQHNRMELFVFTVVTLLLDAVQIVLFLFCVYNTEKLFYYSRLYRLVSRPLGILPLLRAPPKIKISYF